jgi:hypothetical protein
VPAHRPWSWIRPFEVRGICQLKVGKGLLVLVPRE